MLQFFYFAFQRNGEIRNHGRIHIFALLRMQTGTCELIIHFISGCDPEEIRRLNMIRIRNAERKRHSFLDVLRGLMRFRNIERNHIFRADTAPRHIHNIHTAVRAVGCDHKYGHRKQIRLNA